MARTNMKSILVAILTLSACTTSPTSSLEVNTLAHSMQFFRGKIQRTSIDGKVPYGPAFDSVVRRNIDLTTGIIVECVFQEGKVFEATMTRSSEPLIFEATDSSKSFTGKILFENPSALAWSYDLQLIKPRAGQITGKLSEGNGARIDPSKGTMVITKFWNKQVRIHEEYTAISAEEYTTLVSNLPKPLVSEVSKLCGSAASVK